MQLADLFGLASTETRIPNAGPIIMKSNNLFLFLAVSLPFFGYQIHADTVTLTVTAAAGQTKRTQFLVPSNIVAQVVHLHDSPTSGSGWLTININGLDFKYTELGVNTSGKNIPLIMGPATITLTANNPNAAGQDNILCTISTSEPSQFTPNTAVVIPADSAGPVTIILESSVDLINCTSALPGTYGTSTTNRFFRVRAQR
jgi:hypothetical protein